MPMISELIQSQIETFAVMLSAGILTETIWQIKKYIQYRSRGKVCSVCGELLFWVGAIVIITKFLYYSSFGKISFHAAAGFLAGLLLWKKICCDIIEIVWVEKEEAENLKTTARSSILRRPENKGWKKGGQKRKRKKKK